VITFADASIEPLEPAIDKKRDFGATTAAWAIVQECRLNSDQNSSEHVSEHAPVIRQLVELRLQRGDSEEAGRRSCSIARESRWCLSFRRRKRGERGGEVARVLALAPVGLFVAERAKAGRSWLRVAFLPVRARHRVLRHWSRRLRESSRGGSARQAIVLTLRRVLSQLSNNSTGGAMIKTTTVDSEKKGQPAAVREPNRRAGQHRPPGPSGSH
jgi:hypothetical protein